MSNKDRDHFVSLELESRRIVLKIVDVVERRNAMLKTGPNLVLGKFEGFLPGFEAWAVAVGEELMIQLRDVVTEMSVVRRRVCERDPDAELSFQLEQEFYRKLQLLETLKSIGEFKLGEDLEFFQSFERAWRSDSTYGCFVFE